MLHQSPWRGLWPKHRLSPTQTGQQHRQLEIPASTGCSNCGASSHVARSRDCPAATRVCRSCGRLGHYISRCRTSRGRLSSSSSFHLVQVIAVVSRHLEVRTNFVNGSSSATQDVAAVEVINCALVGSIQTSALGSFKRLRCRPTYTRT